MRLRLDYALRESEARPQHFGCRDCAKISDTDARLNFAVLYNRGQWALLRHETYATPLSLPEAHETKSRDSRKTGDIQSRPVRSLYDSNAFLRL